MGSTSLDIAGSMGIKIRFVTCPKCREILPEMPGIPFYKCGKCATIILANNNNTGSVSETNPTKKHGNSCRGKGNDKGNYLVGDPCSSSESARRNDKFPAGDEQPKEDEDMHLPKENSKNKSCPNTESVQGRNAERTMMEQRDKVLDENNAACLEGSLNLEEGNKINAAVGTRNESMLTELVPQDDNYFKGTQKKLHNFTPPGSAEILESFPRSRRSPIGSISKSPTKISNACDVTNFKGTGNISVYRPRLKARSRFMKMQNGQSLIVHEPTASPSISKVNNDLISRGGDWKDSKLPEARKHGYAIRNKLRGGNNDSDTHKMSYITRSSQLPHENGIPSGIKHNVSHQYTEPHLPNSSFYDPDKMHLLKKVYELAEILNETHISNRVQNRRSYARVSGEKKHIPHYYDNLATVQNAYAKVRHSGYSGNHSQGLRWCTHQPKISRVEFSGEATRSRNQMDDVCSCCCHQCCWHHTTKSCSHCIFAQHAIQPSNKYDNGYPSLSQRPQIHSNDKFFAQIFERKADNQLHRNKNMRKLCLREKYQTVRRHIRPVAGGAPIIACHYCSELLQLPAERTLFNRPSYQFRCYSCERIMKLSLEKKVHLIPYLPTISAPPPSEIDDYNTHAKNN